MSIDTPTLDDLTYADLVESGRKRIDDYSETWTDHNASDPGITILELLAWIAETYTYQLDRITDAHRLKYLALLGEKPRPPRPASVDLRMHPATGEGTLIVPVGTKLIAMDDDENTYRFETMEQITLTQARVDRVITDGRRGRLDNSKANGTTGMSFLAFGDAPAPGNALYLGFTADPFETVSRLSVRVTLDETLPDPKVHATTPETAEAVTFEPTVDLAWQHCIDYDRWYLDDAWAPLTVVSDGTNQLYQSGTVTLRRPSAWLRRATNDRGEVLPLLQLDEPYHWIRCVVGTDDYESPPSVDSVAVNVVRAEHRWTIETNDDREADCWRGETCGDDGDGRCGWGVIERDSDLVGTNCPLRNADGSSVSTGRPRQTFEFEYSPVLDATVTVTTKGTGGEDNGEEGGGDDREWESVQWEERDDFDASNSESTHYVLDRVEGEVRFGDGLRGKIPPKGSVVSAPKYVIGGGAAGNVDAVDWRVAAADDVTVKNGYSRYRRGTIGELVDEIVPLGPATGGTDAESIDDTFDRIARDRELPYRAVSPTDYEDVATRTPGLRVGRATAQVVERVPVEGCEPHQKVEVIVVPESTLDEPKPSPGFIAAVADHLETHRLLTDCVTVKVPSYVRIGVDATVRIDPNASVESSTDAIEEALTRFLNPLDGFEGNGWPFGRSLYRSELHETLERVPGVECVTRLGVRTGDGRGMDADGTVVLSGTELLSSAEHDVTVEFGTREPSTPRGA